MFSTKRGQITVFIILGIVILMSSAIYIYFQKNSITTQPTQIIDRKTTTLHPFVEGCLDIAATDALNRIGLTGGYINYPLAIQNNPASYLKVSPIGDSNIPYWWYNGENRIPPIEFIQQQMEEYIEENIDFCINNFSEIKGYEINKTGEIDVQVEFAEEGTNVRMNYPLRAVKIPQMNEFSLSDYDFFVKTPIRFKKVYDVAKFIAEDAKNDYFLEDYTMDLISLADTPNSKYMTPLMNMEFTLKPRIWNIRKTTDNVKTLLSANLQYIKFAGTEYVPISDDFPYLKNHSTWTFDNPENKHPGIHASVVYEEKWPFRIDISPTKGGVLKSGSTRIAQYLSFVGIQTWHFTYDLVYPVIINIHDEAGKNNEEYHFSFATIVSIENNMPKSGNFGSTIFELDNAPTDEEQCEYLKSMNDKEVTFATIDEFTGKPRAHVNISVTCGRYTCPIGETVIDENNHGSYASISAKAPYCGNAAITASREGYEDKRIIKSLNSDTGIIEIKLKPVVEYKDYEVVKRLYITESDASKNHPSSVEELLEPTERVVIVLKDEYGNEQFINYPVEKINETDELTGEVKEVTVSDPIRLYKWKETYYNVTIYYFENDEENDEFGILGGYQGVLNIKDTSIVSENDFIKFTVIEYHPSDEELMALFLSTVDDVSSKVPSPTLMRKKE